MRALAASILTLALILPGCARDNYMTNRVADFSDIIRLQLMAGAGVGLKVEATRMIQLGGVYTHNNYAWGWANRSLGAWRESIRSWGLLFGHYSEDVSPPRNFYSGDYGWTWPNGVMEFQPASAGGTDLDLLTFRGTLMFLIGVDVEIRVGEVFDFLAGLLQFDPAGDDRDYEAMKTPDAKDAPAADSTSEEPATSNPE